MAKKQPPDYTIIRDTREQLGYHFNPYDKCAGMIRKALKTGDYTLKGFEDILCIERKASTAEISNNMGRKKDAFHNEIKRMDEFRFAFLICEFTLEDVLKFPLNSTVPKHKWNSLKVTGRYMMKCFMEYQLRHNVKVLFCGNKDNAFLTVSSLCKRVNELIHEEKLNGEAN